MSKKLIQSIMVPLEEYPCIPETHTLQQAIQEMGKAQIEREKQKSLPRMALVFDSSFCDLLGVLRRRDIMRGLEPKFLASGPLEYSRKLFDVGIDTNLPELSYDTTVAGIRKRAKRQVGKFILPIKGTISHDDHLMKAIHEMVSLNTSMLPVLKDGSVVGVVRSVDVMNEIARIIES